MRRGFLTVSLLLTLFSKGCAGEEKEKGKESPSSPSWHSPVTLPGDEILRLNQIRIIGTHNSYHIARENPVTTELNYTLPPLKVQLRSFVRQFELDIHYDPHKKVIRVFHLPVVDELSHCDLLRECLEIIRSFSFSHPGHAPIWIFLEPKDDLERELWVEHVEELEKEIQSSFPRERVFTPDDLKGEYPSIALARKERGWPLLGEVRGKVIFVLLDDGGHVHWLYTRGFRGLEGRWMFVTGGENRSYGAVVKVDDPDPPRIQDLIQQGFIVRTRTDAEQGEAERNDTRRLQLAIASSAQILSTDYPLPHPETGYRAIYPGGTPFACVESLAPPPCDPQWIEEFTNGYDISFSLLHLEIETP